MSEKDIIEGNSKEKKKRKKKIVFGKFFELYFILFSTQGKVSLTFRYRRFPLLRKGQTPSAQERCVTHENPEQQGSTVYHWRRKKKSYKVRWVLALQFQVFSQNKILRKPEILHGTIRLNQQYLLHWSILTIKLFLFWNATYLIFRNCQGIPEQSLPSTWLHNYSHDLSG